MKQCLPTRPLHGVIENTLANLRRRSPPSQRQTQKRAVQMPLAIFVFASPVKESPAQAKARPTGARRFYLTLERCIFDMDYPQLSPRRRSRDWVAGCLAGGLVTGWRCCESGRGSRKMKWIRHMIKRSVRITVAWASPELRSRPPPRPCWRLALGSAPNVFSVYYQYG